LTYEIYLLYIIKKKRDERISAAAWTPVPSQDRLLDVEA
jgi:hypothetical protein